MSRPAASRPSVFEVPVSVSRPSSGTTSTLQAENQRLRELLQQQAAASRQLAVGLRQGCEELKQCAADLCRTTESVDSSERRAALYMTFLHRVVELAHDQSAAAENAAGAYPDNKEQMSSAVHTHVVLSAPGVTLDGDEAWRPPPPSHPPPSSFDGNFRGGHRCGWVLCTPWRRSRPASKRFLPRAVHGDKSRSSGPSLSTMQEVAPVLSNNNSISPRPPALASTSPMPSSQPDTHSPTGSNPGPQPNTTCHPDACAHPSTRPERPPMPPNVAPLNLSSLDLSAAARKDDLPTHRASARASTQATKDTPHHAQAASPPASHSEPGAEPKAEAQPEVKPEVKPEAKPVSEAKPDTEPDAKAEPDAEVRVGRLPALARIGFSSSFALRRASTSSEVGGSSALLEEANEFAVRADEKAVHEEIVRSLGEMVSSHTKPNPPLALHAQAVRSLAKIVSRHVCPFVMVRHPNRARARTRTRTQSSRVPPDVMVRCIRAYQHERRRKGRPWAQCSLESIRHVVEWRHRSEVEQIARWSASQPDLSIKIGDGASRASPLTGVGSGLGDLDLSDHDRTEALRRDTKRIDTLWRSEPCACVSGTAGRACG